MDTIGEKIRIQRLIKNYSQEYMSYMLDISQAAYSKMERNETEISVTRLLAIADILEISPFILLPKSKYGFAINPEFFLRTIHKIKKIWSSHLSERKKQAKSFQFIKSTHSDISKSAEQ